MPVTVGTTKKIGNKTYIFSGTGQNIHECAMELKKFSFFDIDECGICGSTDLYLDAYVAQDSFNYTVVRCRKCRANLTFGHPKKDKDTAYLRKNNDGNLDWKEFVEKEEK